VSFPFALPKCFADGSQSRVYPGHTKPRTENEAESPGKKRRESEVKNGLSLIRTYSKRISRVAKGRQSFLLATMTRDIKDGGSYQHEEANNHASATDISDKMEKADETIGLLSQPTDVLEDGNDLNTTSVQSKKSSNDLRKLEHRRSASLPLLICSGDNVEYGGGVLEAVGPSNSDREIKRGRRVTTYESAWLKCEETRKFETIREFEAIDRYPTKSTQALEPSMQQTENLERHFDPLEYKAIAVFTRPLTPEGPSNFRDLPFLTYGVDVDGSPDSRQLLSGSAKGGDPVEYQQGSYGYHGPSQNAWRQRERPNSKRHRQTQG
jgi:hypothetical protein